MNFKNPGASLILLLMFGTVLLAAPGVVAADEVHTETVEITDHEELTVETDWSSSAGTDGAHANVEVTDENGTVVDNATMQAEDGNTTRHTFNVSDYSEGNYTVHVYEFDGNDSASTGYIEATYVSLSDTGGSLGGFLGGLSNTEIGLGIAALVGAVLLAKDD